jgi:energy-coupling factor transporter ATP-binding protein EcfA2
VIQGASGSGKSTYAMALAGLHVKEGFKVFRHRFEKQRQDSLKHVALFVSTCVHKAVIILDDANVWATSLDLLEIAKTATVHGKVRIIATWTTDDSDDTIRLQTSDLPKQNLTWLDLRPTVIETLLKFERDVVDVLQKYEGDRSIGSLGLGYLNSSLKTRISSLGDKPQTVYEFIFGLRGDAAVADELAELFQESRSDVPVLCVAIEQIAGFEQPMAADDIVAVCKRITIAKDLPAATPDWVNEVLHRQVSKRRLVRIRGQFTTIHRKWAARLIAAGLKLPATNETTEKLLKQELQIAETPPERMLRLWSWLRSLDDSRPFIKAWLKSLSPDDWALFVSRCAHQGIMEVGFLADRMHLLFDDKTWSETVATAFRKNAPQIIQLVYSASPADWYWLQELASTTGHACPDLLKEVLLGWERQKVAKLLLEATPNQFRTITWFFSSARNCCPGWPQEVGQFVSWEDFSKRLILVEKGDLNSLFEGCAVFTALGYKRRRSTCRKLAEVMGSILQGASLDDRGTSTA